VFLVFEVPGYALLIQAAKTGQDHDQPALITAVQKAGISVSTWANPFLQLHVVSHLLRWNRDWVA